MKTTKAKYELIRDELLDAIRTGDIKPESMLPSEADYCKKYDVSRITVRKALDELASRGYVYRVQGIGTFVRKRDDKKQDGRSKSIVLVSAHFRDGFFSGMIADIIGGVEAVLSEAGYSCITVMEPRNEEGIDAFVRNIGTLNPYGIIYSFYLGQNIQKELMKLNIPIVFLDTEPQDSGFDIVTGEDFESAYRATQLLIQSGCKKIGYYTAYNLQYSTNDLRSRGVKQAIGELGGSYEDRFFRIPEVNDKNNTHFKVSQLDMVSDVKGFLAENSDMDALVAFNDSAAYAVLVAAQELEIRIPEDLKIISYGNYYRFTPGIGITSFEQHFETYGREAAKLILQRIHKEIPEIQQRRKVSFELIRRESF